MENFVHSSVDRDLAKILAFPFFIIKTTKMDLAFRCMSGIGLRNVILGKMAFK
jgi:hypothetical protein